MAKRVETSLGARSTKAPKVARTKSKSTATKRTKKKKVQAEPSEPVDDYDKKVGDHRLRLGSIEAILDHTFGESAQANPQLWDRRAYLMLVGLVYDRLCAEDVSTDEVVKLAKVLAENRRAEVQAVRHGAVAATDDDHSSNPPGDELPENFADAIRQVYGVTLESTDGT